MAKDVTIGVGVDGADAAQQDLKQVKAGVEEVGAAGAAQAAGAEKSAAASEHQGAAAGKADAATRKQAAAQRHAAESARMAAGDVAKLSAAEQAQAGAADQATAATTKTGRATGDAAKQTKLFDDSAKTAATGILAQFNPTLASMANVMVDVIKGAGALSGALIGAIAAGVGLGAIAVAFQAIDEAQRNAVERLREYVRLQKEAREQGRSERVAVADRLEEAGVFGGAKDAQQRVAGLMQQGYDRDLAQFGAIAEQLGVATGDDQLRQVMAGYLARGRQDRFAATQSPEERRKMVAELQQAGGSAEAQAALAARVRDVGDQARIEAGRAEDAAPDPFEVALAEEQRREGLNEQDVEYIRQLRRTGSSGVADVFRGQIDYVDRAEQALRGGDLQGVLEQEYAEGGTRKIGALVRSLKRVQAAAYAESEQSYADEQPGGAAAGGAVTINITNNETHNNIATVVPERAARPRPLTEEDWLGGMEN